jgi:LmbE family N-acetylglucosaminyl deacetylase
LGREKAAVSATSMQFSQLQADVYVPTGTDLVGALARTTHLCATAHPDDIEIMAYHGIIECRGREDRWFSGVVVTNGAGSPRTGRYAKVSDAQMQAIRRREQRRAARLGGYSIQIQLAHPSAAEKRPGHPGVSADLRQIFAGCRPEVVYLHNPADKHDTHVAVFLRCLEAIRSLLKPQRPHVVFGCEARRDLDWLPDAKKVVLDVSAQPQLALQLPTVFKSQIAGGNSYDLATLGRRAAHASFHAAHAADEVTALTFAMDLTILAKVDSIDVKEHVRGLLRRFRDDVVARLHKFA